MRKSRGGRGSRGLPLDAEVLDKKLLTYQSSQTSGHTIDNDNDTMSIQNKTIHDASANVLADKSTVEQTDGTVERTKLSWTK